MNNLRTKFFLCIFISCIIVFSFVNSQENTDVTTGPTAEAGKRVVGEKAHQNCERYSQQHISEQFIYLNVPGGCRFQEAPEPLTPFRNIKLDHYSLHQSRTSARISQAVHVNDAQAGIGGVDARPRHFTHMAILGYGEEEDNKWACGGSLISENFILTAGHCTIDNFLGKVRRIRVGDLDLSSTRDDARPQDFNVAEIINHPEYHSPQRYNDIALLRLDKPVSLSHYAIPACLGLDPLEIGDMVSATGWGRVGYTGDASPILQKMTLEIYGIDECNTTYGQAGLFSPRKLRHGIVEDTQICAGHRTRIVDTCQGDSGGPLQVINRNIYCMYSIIGITSFGFPCGTLDVPGVYTRVFPYVEWIENIVWP